MKKKTRYHTVTITRPQILHLQLHFPLGHEIQTALPIVLHEIPDRRSRTGPRPFLLFLVLSLRQEAGKVLEMGSREAATAAAAAAAAAIAIAIATATATATTTTTTPPPPPRLRLRLATCDYKYDYNNNCSYGESHRYSSKCPASPFTDGWVRAQSIGSQVTTGRQMHQTQTKSPTALAFGAMTRVERGARLNFRTTIDGDSLSETSGLIGLCPNGVLPNAAPKSEWQLIAGCLVLN